MYIKVYLIILRLFKKIKIAKEELFMLAIAKILHYRLLIFLMDLPINMVGPYI